MKIGVLGTGIVGQTLATRLVDLGHDVTMGSRSSSNQTAHDWAATHNSQSGSFDDAAKGSEVIFNCVNGEHTMEALAIIAPENIDGKVLVDVANELEIVDGKPISRASVTHSLAQRIQDAYPKTRVVKSLNTINCNVMVNPGLISGDHNVFMSGDNHDAKQQVREILQSFGWPQSSIIDLGGIETAVGPEMYMSLWLALWMSGSVGQNGLHSIAVVHG